MCVCVGMSVLLQLVELGANKHQVRNYGPPPPLVSKCYPPVLGMSLSLALSNAVILMTGN